MGETFDVELKDGTTLPYHLQFRENRLDAPAPFTHYFVDVWHNGVQIGDKLPSKTVNGEIFRTTFHRFIWRAALVWSNIKDGDTFRVKYDFQIIH